MTVSLSSFVSTKAPFVRHGWTANRIALAYMACLIPPLLAGFRGYGSGLLPVLAVSVIAVVLWQAVFCYLRRRRLGLDGLVSALVFALVIGPSVPLWQAALAISFGVVLAEQVFGGRGFNFLNPVVAALAFLVFSFPSASFGEAPAWLSASAIPAAVLLMWGRLIPWRMFAGVLASLSAAIAVFGNGTEVSAFFQGYGVFLLVFLACDPVSSASTNAGRWVNGLLVGGLIWFFAPAGDLAAGPVPFVQAILLGSIFAPLIDAVAVLANVRKRRARRG